MNKKEIKSQQKLVDSINDNNRKEIWLKLTGAGEMLQKNPNYYSELKEEAGKKYNKAMKQIDKDIERTFPYNPVLNRTILRRILESYVIRNPSVGYCQGLNFIVAVLLFLNFSEEETFWMYTQIIENYIPTTYYNSMSGVVLDQKVFHHLLLVKMPKLSAHLEKIGIETNIINVQWFVCMFSYSFNLKIVTFFWDNIFVKGYPIIFCLSLSVFFLLRNRVFLENEFVESLSLIDSECQKIDPKIVKKTMKKKTCRVPFSFIYWLRKTYADEVVNEYQVRFDCILPEAVLFNSISDHCRDDNDCKQKIFLTENFFTFKSSSILCVDDYLESQSYAKSFQVQLCTESVLPGKKNHECSFDQDSDRELPQESLRRTVLSVPNRKTLTFVSDKFKIEDFT